MMTKRKKRFVLKHAKSSAALVSLGIHAVLVVVALSFVAVTVIQKEEPQFEAKPLNRPKMQLKKLQVPVNIKKKKPQKPKLRKRIVIKPRLNQMTPEIKMPEISGVKGGLGNSAGSGLGGSGSLGFNMPEVELFGVKSKGEKVFIILDASPYMMVDHMGGIPAYTIIKDELVRILEGLNSTVLFNIAVYDRYAITRFPQMVSATKDNVDKVEEWLKPLNAVKRGMGNKDYGTTTLGPGGSRVQGDLKVDPLKGVPGEWATPTLLAMKQQADAVYVLTCRWGELRYKSGSKDRNWSEKDQKEYEENLAEARKMLAKDNERRKAKGQPPRVIPSNRALVRAYIKNARIPPSGNTYHRYSPGEMVDAFCAIRQESKSDEIPVKSGLHRKKEQFSINVIHFVPEGSGSAPEGRFNAVTEKSGGEYKKIEGMKAIQSYVDNAAVN